MKIFNFPFLISTKEIQQKNQTGTKREWSFSLAGTENDFFWKESIYGKTNASHRG